MAIPLGILLAVFLRLDLPEYKNTLKRALYWGFWLSLFFVAVKVGTRNAITREGFEALTIVIAIVADYDRYFYGTETIASVIIPPDFSGEPTDFVHGQAPIEERM